MQSDEASRIACQAQLEMAHADPPRMRLPIFNIKARNRHLNDNKPGPGHQIEELGQTA